MSEPIKREDVERLKQRAKDGPIYFARDEIIRLCDELMAMDERIRLAEKEQEHILNGPRCGCECEPCKCHRHYRAERDSLRKLAGELVGALRNCRRDANILLQVLMAHQENTHEFLEEDDASIVNQIEESI